MTRCRDAFIGLGSNCGERLENLKTALCLLEREREVRLLRVSSVYETRAVGGPPQGPFLNAVGRIRTSLAACALLGRLLAVEGRMGRKRKTRFGPREIDLDLLSYGDDVIRSESLTLPHPRLRERRFVLIPLREIAPNWVHPQTGESVSDLLRRTDEEYWVRFHCKLNLEGRKRTV